MPWITNVPMSDITNGTFPNTHGGVLIQIVNTVADFPEVPEDRIQEFSEAPYQFRFEDIEEDEKIVDLTFGIQQWQAAEIVEILQRALAADKNVVVHCHAGICRSGAVVEVAEMMGFDTLNTHRQPNCMVKKALMRELGWTYD
jgi:predicted protein tyrosine phosphatase